jgi:hypothetical protein
MLQSAELKAQRLELALTRDVHEASVAAANGQRIAQEAQVKQAEESFRLVREELLLKTEENRTAKQQLADEATDDQIENLLYALDWLADHSSLVTNGTDVFVFPRSSGPADTRSRLHHYADQISVAITAFDVTYRIGPADLHEVERQFVGKLKVAIETAVNIDQLRADCSVGKQNQIRIAEFDVLHSGLVQLDAFVTSPPDRSSPPVTVSADLRESVARILDELAVGSKVLEVPIPNTTFSERLNILELALNEEAGARSMPNAKK